MQAEALVLQPVLGGSLSVGWVHCSAVCHLRRKKMKRMQKKFQVECHYFMTMIFFFYFSLVV